MPSRPRALRAGPLSFRAKGALPVPTPDPYPRTSLYLSLACIAAALAMAFVWIPADTGSGMTIKQRGRLSIGDAMAPMLAAAVIGLGGLMVFVQKREPYPQGIGWSNLAFVLKFLGLCALGFGIMRWSGPLAVTASNALTGSELEYRLLRDTAPWKFIGFFLGSSFLIAALISLTEGRLRPRTALIAVLATLALILLYDVPFDDLLLPPNGDV